MKKSFIAFIISSVVVVGGGAWWYSRSNDSAMPNKAGASRAGGGFGGMGNRTQPVSVAAVRKQDIRIVISAIGNVTALNTAAIHSRVDGLLTKVTFLEGQQVKAGQVLAQIDPAPFQVALDSAQATLAKDVAQLKNAQMDLVRYKDLLAKDSIQSQQVDTQDALVKQNAATVKADQAAVDTAKMQLGWTQITAPISGRLGLRLVDTGNMIHASDASGLVNITQTQPIAGVFAVPEANLTQLMRQIKVKAPLQVEAWDRELKNKLATGKILATDNAVDPTTGTIKIKAAFANVDDSLFPNQFVNIKLQVDTIKDAITVPTSAIQRGSQGIYVYVVGSDSAVAVRRIKMGITDGDWVEVQSFDETQLVVGDQVVIDGADRLREGAKVEVVVQQKQGGGKGNRGGGDKSKAPADASAKDTSSKTPTAPSAAPSQSADRPRWMDFLPPNTSAADIEKIKKMEPDERRDYIRKLRQQ